MAQKLIPKEILDTLPPLYATEKMSNPIVHVKLFTPDSNWSWFIMEYSPQEKLCFGLVQGQEEELGYFTLKELEEVRGVMGLPVERDLYFKPVKLSEIKK
jgi:hypothetical protein